MMIQIDDEIELKRLNPEFLSELLEKNLEAINSEFDISFNQAIELRRKVKDWEDQISHPAKMIDAVLKETSRTLKLTDQIIRKEQNEEDCSALFDEIEEKVNLITSNNIDFSLLSNQIIKKLKDIIFELETLKVKNDIGGIANSSLLNNEIFKLIIEVLKFSIPFVLSFKVGTYIEEKLEVLGPVISKLIPAIIFFLIIDKVVKCIELNLTWKRVKYLQKRYSVSLLNIKQQKVFLNELENNLRKQKS